MADFATVDDVNGRLIGRDLTDAERAKVPAYLADASAMMRSRFPNLDTDDNPNAVGVCCAMVLRVVGNPDGKRQETIDDYSYLIDSSRSAGELYITEHEAELLRPQQRSRSAFSIVPTAPVESA